MGEFGVVIGELNGRRVYEDDSEEAEQHRADSLRIADSEQEHRESDSGIAQKEVINKV